MRYSLRFLAAVAVALGAGGCSVHMKTLANDPGNQLLNRSKTALCLPVDTIHVSYVDNTKAIADTLFNDSFFIEAANSLLLYEAAKNFPLRQLDGAPKDASFGADSLAAFRRGGYSRLTHDTASLPLIAGLVRDLAKKYNADLVIVPYAYAVRNVVIRPAGLAKRQVHRTRLRPVRYPTPPKRNSMCRSGTKPAPFCTNASAQATRAGRSSILS